MVAVRHMLLVSIRTFSASHGYCQEGMRLGTRPVAAMAMRNVFSKSSHYKEALQSHGDIFVDLRGIKRLEKHGDERGCLAWLFGSG